MVDLRRATLEDLAVVLRIGDALTKEDAGKHAEAFNLDWIAQEGEAAYTQMLGDERHVVTLAEVGGTAVGFLSGAVREPSTWRTARMAEIFALYVIPEYRDQSVGERLVWSFLPWAREQGAERIVVAAFAANEAALRFYRRVGFAPFEVMLEQPVERRKKYGNEENQMTPDDNTPGQSRFQHVEIRARKSKGDVQKLTNELYNRDANESEYRMSLEERAVWTDELQDLMKRHARSLDPDRRTRVLDVGTGTGAFAVLLAEMGFDVTGIDGAKEMIELGTKRLKDQDPLVAALVSLEPVDWDDVSFSVAGASTPVGYFDAVVSRHVTTHLYDPIDAFTMWATWLRPGGTLIIVDGLWRRSGWSDGYDELIDDLPLSVVSGLGTITYLVEKTEQFEIRYRRLLARINRDPMLSPHASGPRYVLVAQKVDGKKKASGKRRGKR